MPDLFMPRLSDSMTEGTIISWRKGDGAWVEAGEEIAEIETDKATMSFEAEGSGILHQVAAEGETVPVGAVIARIGEGESSEGAAAPSAAGRAPTPPRRVPAIGAAQAEDGPTASPLARRMALRFGVDLREVRGSGPRGRILKADVRAAAEHGGEAIAPVPAAQVDSAKGAVEAIELSKLQRIVAARMAASKATVPDFWVSAEVDMEPVEDLRGRLRELLDPAPSINDLILRAAAVALRRHPRVNGSFRDEHFELHSRINVGLAVAAEDALVVPVVLDADRRSLAELAVETRRLAAAVREGTVSPGDLEGSTFTISNLGMMGVRRFAGIVDIPCAAILCIGAVEPRPLARDGEVVVAPTMELTLVSDHRILYGVDAAAFLAEVRSLLEQPLSFLV